ncbi:MAG: hypothetical protein J6X60_07255, partial [Ruminiclostridium sp.]|nr:hypothetical protein [Ruminiclostridium sp.]
MGKVLLIGGSPMTGKSTAARKIASMYEISAVSTDDIGEILKTAADIDPMKGMNYLDYYENTDIDTLIKDLETYHLAIRNAVTRMIEIHSGWGASMIIEGYAIYPDIKLTANTSAVWFTAPEELLRSRLEKSAAFARASEKAKEHYLQRSLRHDRL